MDDLGKLLLFKDVIEQGGFSKAAALRGLNHSTVSKHLKSLEADLGVTLALLGNMRIEVVDVGYEAPVGAGGGR